MKSDNHLLNGALVYFQYADPSCIEGIETGDLLMRLDDGGAWNASDLAAGRIRTEGRFYSVYPLDVWSTFAVTIERRPDEFPIFGSARPDKVTFLQFFNDRDKDDRPCFWLETLGLETSIFLNSYVGDTKEDIALDVPIYGKTRWVQEVRPKSDGTIDIRLRANGRVVFERMGFHAEAAGGIQRPHAKFGLYMSKGAGRAMSGTPTLRARYSGVTIHQGEAVVADLIGTASVPFIPAPQLQEADAGPLPVVAAEPKPAPQPQTPPVTPTPKPSPAPAPAPGTVEPVPDRNGLPMPRSLIEWVDSIENASRDVLSEIQRAGHPHADLAQRAVAAQTALLNALKG